MHDNVCSKNPVIEEETCPLSLGIVNMVAVETQWVVVFLVGEPGQSTHYGSAKRIDELSQAHT